MAGPFHLAAGQPLSAEAGPEDHTGPKQFRRVWKSEISDIGVGKWGYSKEPYGFGRAGGIAGPIVGGGMVRAAGGKAALPVSLTLERPNPVEVAEPRAIRQNGSPPGQFPCGGGTNHAGDGFSSDGRVCPCRRVVRRGLGC